MQYKYQMFNGIRFREEWPGGYYINNSIGTNCPNVRMHRYVWEYYNGPIPEGYEVHHIDGNKGNNDISNLQLLTISEHKKFHADNLSEEEKERRRANMRENALPAAIKWHKSEASTEWHKEHIRQQHRNGVFKKKLICTQCGKEYIGTIHKTGGNTFCSNNCKARYLRHKRSLDKSATRDCVICGKTFNCSQWSNRQTCCASCANRLKWRHQREDKTN